MGMTHDIFEVIQDSTNILGNQFNEQNLWLDSVLCAIYIQAGATSCVGSGQSLLDLVVDWPTDSTPLWNRLHRLEEKGGVIETKIDFQSTEFDTIKEEMNGIKDDVKAIKEMFAHFLEQNKK